jgi:hypothetical protein
MCFTYAREHLITDTRGIIVDVNDTTFSQITGYSRAKSAGPEPEHAEFRLAEVILSGHVAGAC